MNPSEDELLEQNFRRASEEARTSLTPRPEALKQTLSKLPAPAVTFSKDNRLSYQEAKISFLNVIHMNLRKFAPQYALAAIAIIAIAGLIRTSTSNPSDAPARVGQAPEQASDRSQTPTDGEDRGIKAGQPSSNDSLDILLADLGQGSDPSFNDEDLAAEGSDETGDELIISLSETYDEETF
ncbi:MAG: hypothetical protein ACEQSB_04165 [Undibacterium sp.]